MSWAHHAWLGSPGACMAQTWARLADMPRDSDECGASVGERSADLRPSLAGAGVRLS